MGYGYGETITMRVINTSSLNGVRILVCGKLLADYMTEKNIPLLNSSNGRYEFAYTDIVEETMRNLPWFQRLYTKVSPYRVITK